MESLNGVNAITIVFAALCIFAIAYRFYGLWVAQKVLNINAARETLQTASRTAKTTSHQ